MSLGTKHGTSHHLRHVKMLYHNFKLDKLNGVKTTDKYWLVLLSFDNMGYE